MAASKHNQDPASLAAALLGPGRWRAAPFGAGKFSDVFAVEGGDARYVLRVAPPDSVLQTFYEYRMMRREPTIHARLLAETDVPVPPILAHDFSRKLANRDFLIMPRLPGQPFSQAALPPSARHRALREWGGYVRKVHRLLQSDGLYGYVGGHPCMPPQATWPAAFALMYRKLLNDIVGCGVYDAGTADTAVSLLQSHMDAFDHDPAPALCHGDLWVTNLLVDEAGGVTGLLDFDRACWGDIEWDLAIAEYCGVTSGPFWDGYGERIETQAGPAAIRRLFYLLYEHQKYIVISMSSRRNDPARARRYAADSLAAMDAFRRTGAPAFPV
ncbi:MAG: aminoglycoside phosphotransferase family protein [Kiritimatiellae bacterium]|nr:aminoglycoside phosphotransferase family protein [Kiritimatiellia bacterium]